MIMTQTNHKNQSLLIGGLSMLVGLLCSACFFASCSEGKKAMAPAVSDSIMLPMMTSTGVSTLISDSGVVRYKIIAEEWDVYDKLDTSKWSFEKGVYLEKFDNQMRIEAKVKADTAYYYDRLKLWDLRGHVNILNIKGEKFNTSQLFWDQDKERVYSDRFIRIQQVDKILTGYGFTSNQQFTDYVIHNTAGIFPVEDTPRDSLSNDSVHS